MSSIPKDTSLEERVLIPSQSTLAFLQKYIYFYEMNCYTFAINFLQPTSDRYFVGKISGEESEAAQSYSDAELLKLFILDMAKLNISVRISTLEEEVSDPNEWKIAILNVRDFQSSRNYDYHFLREEKPGVWIQKFPNSDYPTYCDDRNHLISNPEDAAYDFNYQLVGYYVLKKKVKKIA